MADLEKSIAGILSDNIHRAVLSAPRPASPYRRVNFTLLETGWQAERLTETQAFHENFPPKGLAPRLQAELNDCFTRLTAFGEKAEHSLRITKKGRVLYNRLLLHTAEPPAPPSPHNREKPRLLAEGQTIPPLVDMGVFTPEGRVVQAMAHKYRQINRFVELVDDELKNYTGKSIGVIDFGSGKSYLTFILYYYLTQIKGISARVLGLDLKADVVAASNAAARKYGYEGLAFQVGDIAGWQAESPVDMVVSLHACDTATDHALANAVAWNTRYIFSAPCCQHQLNAQMASEELAILTRYGVVQERAAALFTDAIRANLLTAAGYRAQLLEFVDFSHTPKNLLLRARKTAVDEKARRRALAEVQRLCAAFGFAPTLYGLLQKQGVLPAEEMNSTEKPENAEIR